MNSRLCRGWSSSGWIGARRRVGEPAVDHAAGEPGEPGLVAEQGHRQPGLQQGLGQLGDHLRRRVVQPVEHPHQARVDVVGAQRPLRRVVPGDPEQVVALVQRQPQPAGHGGQHLLRRLRAAPLLQPAVVVGGHAAQRRDLLPAQPAGAPARAAGQPDVLGLQGLAAGAQEVGQLGSVHDREYRRRSGGATRDRRSLDERVLPGPRRPPVDWASRTTDIRKETCERAVQDRPHHRRQPGAGPQHGRAPGRPRASTS